MTISSELIQTLTEEGYTHLREMTIDATHIKRGVREDIIVGVRPYIFTGGIVIELDEVGYEERYCYATLTEAITALEAWDGVGDPSGDWIKHKPFERRGPGSKGP